MSLFKKLHLNGSMNPRLPPEKKPVFVNMEAVASFSGGQGGSSIQFVSGKEIIVMETPDEILLAGPEKL
jgi:hypothetical protein